MIRKQFELPDGHYAFVVTPSDGVTLQMEGSELVKEIHDETEWKEAQKLRHKRDKVSDINKETPK